MTSTNLIHSGTAGRDDVRLGGGKPGNVLLVQGTRGTGRTTLVDGLTGLLMAGRPMPYEAAVDTPSNRGTKGTPRRKRLP